MQYDDIRESYLDGLANRVYLPLAAAREKRLRIDFTKRPTPKPEFIGTKVLNHDVPLERLVEFIDWKPFFEVWELRGKYPNRNYPKIFDDETVGPEAKKVFDEAQKMLKEIVSKKLFTAKV